MIMTQRVIRYQWIAELYTITINKAMVVKMIIVSSLPSQHR